MNIRELIEQNSGITLAVSALDLKEFALELIEECCKGSAEKPKEDKVLTPKQTADALHITLTTLWRWNKSGYFCPQTYKGKRPLYLQSQVDAILNGTLVMPELRV